MNDTYYLPRAVPVVTAPCGCELDGRQGFNADACGLHRLVWSDGTGPSVCPCQCHQQQETAR